MRVNLLGALAFAACCAAVPALAKEWVIDYDHSRLGFTGMQSDDPFTGEFKKFDAHIDFDPEKPETGKIAASIDIASITAGTPERDTYLPQPDWFDTAKFPQAQFVSTAIKKAACNGPIPSAGAVVGCYEAAGTLTIKGIANPVVLAFNLAQEFDHYRARGKLTLLRNNFHIGEHDWASEAYVKYAVDVTVDMAAKPTR